VTNINFVFETSPNTKPKEKKVGDMAYYIPLSEKVEGDMSPVFPHQIAPMPGRYDLEHGLACVGPGRAADSVRRAFDQHINVGYSST